LCWRIQIKIENSKFEIARIVSLQPSATVILARLGLLDRLVACTRYCLDVCPAAAGRAIVADSWTARAEEILGARPQLVIAAVPYQAEAVAEILKAGVRFLGLAPRTLADIYTDIAAIASLLGAGDRGQQVIAEMQREIEAVRDRAQAAAGRPRVFCEEWGKPILRSQPWVAELVEAAGGVFVGEAGKQASAEQVAAEAPDVIVAAWCGAGERVPLEKIVADRGWNELRAVRQGRVYCVRDELLNTPAPVLLAGLRALACAIHPEIFGEGADGLRRIVQ
jgi:iron complex transport system substrate-binding protein